MQSSDMDAAVKEESGGGELAIEIEGEEPPPPPPGREGAAATAEDWRRALSRVVPAVVVLRTTAPRAFDTEPAGASYATGFVVDKARGIILTNRHVVKPGEMPYDGAIAMATRRLRGFAGADVLFFVFVVIVMATWWMEIISTTNPKSKKTNAPVKKQSKRKEHPRTIEIGGIRKYEQQLYLRN